MNVDPHGVKRSGGPIDRLRAMAKRQGPVEYPTLDLDEVADIIEALADELIEAQAELAGDWEYF